MILRSRYSSFLGEPKGEMSGISVFELSNEQLGRGFTYLVKCMSPSSFLEIEIAFMIRKNEIPRASITIVKIEATATELIP